MAYEPKTWSCGETITADALNHIEQGIEEASQGGGGCDCGFECTETFVQVLNDSLTTASMGSFSGVQFAPSQPIEGDSIIVTLNGTDYTLPKSTVSFGDLYGEADSGGNPVFTDYPCAVGVMPGQHYFFTPSDGTYQVEIDVTDSTAETTECFEKAVKSVVGEAPKHVKDGTSESVVEGDVNQNVASANYSHAEGHGTIASGYASHAEGSQASAEGYASHAEGDGSVASGDFSHAEGHSTASGNYAHAEGNGTTASRNCAHAEGNGTTASGDDSHSEGNGTTASGAKSHAEGDGTTASGAKSHAEGDGSEASGSCSHAEGINTIANHIGQHVFGANNVADPSSASANSRGTYVEIVGNGNGRNTRSNARTLDWSGNESLQGSLTLGKGTADETTITATQLKALLALLNA